MILGGQLPGKVGRRRFFIWLHGQAVKTPPFHGGNSGSIPDGVTKKRAKKHSDLNIRVFFLYSVRRFSMGRSGAFIAIALFYSGTFIGIALFYEGFQPWDGILFILAFGGYFIP